MAMSVRLLIVDDIECVRVGVRTLLSGNNDWQVCGEAANGVEAIAKVQELRPDVIILDVSMPGLNGLQAAAAIREIAPSTRIVLYTVHNIVPTAHSLLCADACASKSGPAQDLIATVERVLKSYAATIASL